MATATLLRECGQKRRDKGWTIKRHAREKWRKKTKIQIDRISRDMETRDGRIFGQQFDCRMERRCDDKVSESKGARDDRGSEFRRNEMGGGSWKWVGRKERVLLLSTLKHRTKFVLIFFSLVLFWFPCFLFTFHLLDGKLSLSLSRAILINGDCFGSGGERTNEGTRSSSSPSCRAVWILCDHPTPLALHLRPTFIALYARRV